ncbi:hypothetical protein QYE76_033725 [Lolium multiflorum]|uniref:DUF4218 domain-containing protein n=1 Tax=Lolium multiflorum TaxID=4521 RepID=A0AAD8VJJ6_LOLMU|nr:hypothetical protein QYE76_033725 [Lolium multiflorum]
MTQILPVAMRGIMDDHVRETLFGLCNFFDVISRKSIGVKQLNRLQEEIIEILCELEIYFPPAFFDIMVHLLVHVVDDIIHLGPTFLHNMMPFERLNGVIKGFYEPTTDGGDHTGGDGVGEADGSGNPAAKKKKKPRKDRKPTVLTNTTSEITLVSESGQPKEPLDVAAGYGMQLGCIVRESMSINTVNIRGEGNEHLVELCLRKLHRRYTFPAPYNNLERSNPVNKLAITKMSNALSSWKSRVKAKIDKGESFESIKKGEPMLDEAEFQIFKERLDSEDAKAWTEWGRQMHELNLGAHHLGSGGYRGKIPIWEKEDEELARAGKPNPWLKMTDPQVRYFVRARYTLDRNTMEFVTEHDDVRKFEEKLVLWKVLEGSRKVRKKPPRKVESTRDSTSMAGQP